jgi:hypothetical protein
MAIRIDDFLASQRKLTRVMFFFVVAGKRNLKLFSPPKSVDERWEVGLMNVFESNTSLRRTLYVSYLFSYFISQKRLGEKN